MPPDFFIAPCQQLNGNCQIVGVVCSSTTRNGQFGLCEYPPEERLPAHMQHHNQDDWIAHVHNLAAQEVTFKAIDNCVPILRANGELESRCDGVLIYKNNLIFVELKDRNSQGWLAKGREQIIITIASFAANYDVDDFNIVVAYICNKQRPMAVTSISEQVQRFKDATANILNNGGSLLKAERNIYI